MASEIKVIVKSDGLKLRSELEGASVEMPQRVRRMTLHWGQLLLARVKANAATGFHAPGMRHIPGTGPGPNVATGTYLRSITLEPRIDRYNAEVTVGTNQVRGPRLEFGFVGTDAAGRRYPRKENVRRGKKGAPNARKGYPYPHFLPALKWVAPQFTQAIADLGETL